MCLGLLDTITSTADAKDCPGVCVHALATIICYDVLEDVVCPSSSMKCCVEPPPPNATEKAPNTSIINHTTTATSTTAEKVTTISTTLAPIATTSKQQASYLLKYIASDDKSKRKNSNNNKEEPASTKACPGVCVAERIADYCEAILTTEDLCKPSLKCCVSSDAFGDKIPPNLIIPNKTKTNYSRTEVRTTPKPLSTTTHLIRTPPPSLKPFKPCRGECVGGFLALFCDDIDAEAECPSEGSCCISSSSEETITTTSPRPTTPDPGPRCPGFCLLNIMAAFCERPSVLIPHTSNCKRGSVCCDNTRTVVTLARPKPRPHQPLVTTSTTTIDPRSECPGSCIVSYLSFTCFRNAEMTELFKCRKSGTKCCARKSLIKEALGQKEESTHKESTSAIIDHTTVSIQDTAQTLESTKIMSTTSRPPVYSKYVCGVKGTSRVGRVVGGEDGDQAEWCWQVALINSLNQYLCGAALIGTQWVLTAAHCVTNIVRSGDAIYVRVGDHDLTRKYGSPGAQTLRVATTYIHHNHNSQTLDNDIALLKLHGQAELKEGVCLVCLPARGVSHAAGKRCTVTGYGYMGEAGPIPLRVREAEIPIVSDTECIRKVNAVTEKIFILPASSFCAGGEEGNDACQ
ncbi:serine proteinase stubble, partial [Asbolus verrucosus]